MRTHSRSIGNLLALLLIAGGTLFSGCSADTPQSLVAAGKLDEAKKDYKSALIRYRSALQLDPSSAETRFLLGRGLLETGEPAGAALELTKALDQKYPAEQVMPLLSRALLLTGEYKKLTTAYGDLTLDDKPATAALKTNVARAWGILGDKAKTEAALQAALSAAPEYGPALVLVASLAAGRGEFPKALEQVAQVLERDASLYDAWMLKGEILLATRSPGADEAFRKVLSLEKAHVPAHAALIGQSLAAGDLPAAKGQLAKLREVLPQHPQTMFSDTLVAYAEQDYKRAQVSVQQVMRVLPDNVMVLELAGVIEGRLGALALAESLLSKALTLNPNLVTVRLNLAHVYVAIEQPAKAMDALRPLLGPDSRIGTAFSLAGEALLRMGDAAGAEVQFARAAKLNPNDVKSHTAVTLAQLMRGDGDAGFATLATLAQESKDITPDLAIISARSKRGEYTEALAASEALLTKAPTSPKTHELRGRLFVALGDAKSARSSFEQALKLEPGHYSATARLVEMDLEQGRIRDAQQRVEALVAADPRNYQFQLLLANVLSRGGASTEELRKIFTNAITNAPTAAEPRLRLIELLLRKRLLKEAVATAEEAASALPNDAVIQEAVGRANLEAGNSGRAITAFRKVAALVANSPIPYSRLAAVYRTVGQRDLAEAAWKKALEIDASFALAQRGLVDHLLTAGRAADAMAYVRELQRRNPTRADGYLRESEVHLRGNAPDAAMASLRRGLAAVKGKSDIPQVLHTTLLRANRPADAQRFATDWLTGHPEDSAFALDVAATAVDNGDPERAESLLRSVLAREPNNAGALNNLAWALIQRKRPGAVELAMRANRLMPNSPPVLDTLAAALVAENRAAEGLGYQQRAVALAPNDNNLRLNLAKAAIAANDKILAKAELERLRSMGTAFKDQGQVTELLQGR